MSVVDFPKQDFAWLKKYYERGFQLVFYNQKEKGPSGKDAVGWQTRRHKFEDYVQGRNVGVFTGTEISPGRFLVDLDFDWADGLPLAKRLLPSTQFGFGRASRPISHCFFTVSQPFPLKVYENIDNKHILEVRCTEMDGSVGHQTMVPPSIHPSGEQVTLQMDGEIGHADHLLRATTLYAIGCMLFFHLGPRGLLHDQRLAIAGFLLSEGLTVDETIAVGEAVAGASGNNVADVKLTVNSTAQRLKAGEKVWGAGQLIKAIGDDGKKVITRIREWLGSKDFIEDSKGKILANNTENVRRAIEKMDIKLTYDSFSNKPFITYPGYNGSGYSGLLEDHLVVRSWFDMEEKFHFRPPKDFYYDVVADISHKHEFHPVLDYLKSLKWDGHSRIANWLIKGANAAETDYVRAVSSIVLMAAVRRITQPGCKYDEMLVLESGQQGLFKSTALRTLCPDEKWFSDDLPLDVDAKQIVERTAGKWIIEASDLSGMSASQVEQLKAMLSRQVDGPVRMAYGRIAIEQPRQFIIIGTTNSYAYLSDSTGNRRFWPIRVQQFDIPWLKCNRDQLWAEAFHREQEGESIRLDPALYAHASMQQERRRIEDPWELKLDESFPMDKKWRLTMDEVWAPLGISIDRRDPRSTDRVQKAMHKLGFKRITVRSGDRVVRGYGRDPGMILDFEQE